MSRIKFNYIASLFFLIVFGIGFFTAHSFMPKLRQWKSNKMFVQSKVYLDESIEGTSDLMQDGIRKARLAHLLDPDNKETFENYNLLLFRAEPSEALRNWSIRLENQNDLVEERILLLERCMDTLRNDDLDPSERKKAGKLAF